VLTPEQKAAAVRQATAWNAAHPDQRSQINRRHANKNKQARAAYRKQWEAANQDKLKAYGAKYSQWHRRQTDLDKDSYGYAMDLYTDPCVYCGAVAEEVDHIVPVSAGGPNHWSNLTASCRPCNRHKHTKPLLHFMLQRS